MRIDVFHIAQLAKLTLTEEEKGKLSQQLHNILDYIDLLNTVNTKNIEPTHQVTGLENVLADDNQQPSLSQQTVLSSTKETHNKSFKVRGIFNDE